MGNNDSVQPPGLRSRCASRVLERTEAEFSRPDAEQRFFVENRIRNAAKRHNIAGEVPWLILLFF